MLPRLLPDYAWAPCPTCRGAQPYAAWPEPEPEPVSITLHCWNAACPVQGFVVLEGARSADRAPARAR